MPSFTHFKDMMGLKNLTRAQQLLRWVTVPEQSGPKIGDGCCAPFRNKVEMGAVWGQTFRA